MFKKENIRKNFLRVKQTADQKLGRSEKTEVLSDDLQTSEKRVELVKQVSTNTHKKITASLLVSSTSASDHEKRLKKMPEAGLAHSMVESAQVLSTECIMGQMYQMCGECQSSLARTHLDYEQEVEENVLGPIQTIIETEIPNISRLKKALTKVTLDMDSAKTRWQSACRQTQTPGVNMSTAAQKVDTVREELEEAQGRVDQAKDAYTTGMFNFIAKETDHCQNLLTLLEAQSRYHEKALAIIKEVIPKMRESLTCNPTKPVYGMPLEEHLRVTNRDIATVLEACVCYLLEYGLEEEGLFRIAGMASKVKKLKASFDAGIDLDDTGDLDPHTVAGALKQYLRELPEPLLTFDKFNDFMAAAQQQGEQQRLQALWVVVDHLPKPNYDNFRYLVKFLSKLKEKSDINKMTPGNIAIVIGPNLIWSEGDSGPNMMNTGILSLITEWIVQHADWFFPGDINFQYSGESCSNLNMSSDSAEHYPLDRTLSTQSGSSVGTPYSSPPANQEPAIANKTQVTPPGPVTPPAGSRSPSVSPASSNNNVAGAPLAESEDMQPSSIQRRQTRKPAPPPPPERPHSVAVTASLKLDSQYKTWPRQASPVVEEEPDINTSEESEQTTTTLLIDKPSRPNPPERISSLSASAPHHHPDRPKVPPPVAPPKHTRSASTGAPVTIPSNQLQVSGNKNLAGSASGSSLDTGGLHETTRPLSNSNNQLTPEYTPNTADSKPQSSSSLARQSISRPPRPLPPPPPPPDSAIIEQTHL